MRLDDRRTRAICAGAIAVLAGVFGSSALDGQSSAHAAKQRKSTTANSQKTSKKSGKSGNSRRNQKVKTGKNAEPLPPIVRTKLHDTCPREMVNVGGYFCIDRWEATVVEKASKLRYSPYYPPHAALSRKVHSIWTTEFDQEVDQARELMLQQGLQPPPQLGQPEADPLQWLFPSSDAGAMGMKTSSIPKGYDLIDAGRTSDAGTPVDAGNDVTAGQSEADAGNTSSNDAATDIGAMDGQHEADVMSYIPTIEAPHGWVLVGDAGADGQGLPRAVMLLPELPAWQTADESEPMALSRPNEIPQGFTPGFVAEQACRNAGKRLCREQEWVFACKGQHQTKHPYGNTYDEGRCNVFRHAHAGMILHGSWSTGLSDPRLNLQYDNTGPLVRRTGHTSFCASKWGNDAIMDMVGNLDEWVDHPSGLFLGGFFSRNTRNGCDARVSNHPRTYFDYSTGFRCCADLASAPPMPEEPGTQGFQR